MDYKYCAGLFDGEGHIGITHNGKQTKNFALRLILCSCNYEVINKLHKQFAGSICVKNKYKNQHRDNWQWKLGGEKAKDFLRRLLPYSIIKKLEIKQALHFPIGKQGKKVSNNMHKKRLIIQKEIREIRHSNYKEVYND